MAVLSPAIRRVGIVDDDEDGAANMRDILREADLDPFIVPMPINDDDPIRVAESLARDFDAVVCDHHLRERAGAVFNGAELASRLYELRRPTVLHTNYIDGLEDEIRLVRRHVPVLLTGAESEPDVILRAFQICRLEFNGLFERSRQPWRTAVRVDECVWERGVVFLAIPEWDAKQRVRMPLALLPRSLQVSARPGLHFMAQVNVQAEHFNDLYVADIEVPLG